MLDLRSLDSQSKRIIGLALLTGLIHLFVGFQSQFILVLNGLGFIALAIALYLLPQLANWRTQIRWVLIVYTAVTIIGYFAIFPQPLDYGLGLVTKAVEVILIVLLFIQSR
ncbi:MAG: hypothetical protein OXK78_19645 [Caldilineaceae bacterium]|nr:hypothetical protein [Caldilineaceae bacterium]